MKCAKSKNNADFWNPTTVKQHSGSFVIKDYLNVLKPFPIASVVPDGMDGNGLKLKKICQFFQVLMLRVPKILKKFIMVSPL